MDKEEGKNKRGERKKEKEKIRGKKIKTKYSEGYFRHFTTSIQQVKLFCQTFCKTASAPSEKPLHRRSQSRSRFRRSRSPAKQALKAGQRRHQAGNAVSYRAPTYGLWNC
jgi:hypothetical protein